MGSTQLGGRFGAGQGRLVGTSLLIALQRSPFAARLVVNLVALLPTAALASGPERAGVVPAPTFAERMLFMLTVVWP